MDKKKEGPLATWIFVIRKRARRIGTIRLV
jgi:hypothetical protein